MHIIKLPFLVKKPTLGCGADLKGAFCLATGEDAVYSDGFGDLGDPDNYAKYEKAVRDAEKRFRISPGVIACDMHPGYFSSRFAEEHARSLLGYKLVRIQHHEAHAASVITDNRLKNGVISVTFDGTGFGRDGAIWGGEFFTGNIGSLKRIAHLDYMPMPGGEIAIKEPWRMALSYIYRAYKKDFSGVRTDLLKGISSRRVKAVITMIDRKINSPETSSAGRFFDSAASIILNKKVARYEADLPITLEEKALLGYEGEYRFDIKWQRGMFIIIPDKTIKGIITDLLKGADIKEVSSKFHNTVASMIRNVCSGIRQRYGIKKVALSGGVFQNRYLTEKTSNLLKANGFKVYGHVNVPTNDIGIALGQIAIANAD